MDVVNDAWDFATKFLSPWENATSQTTGFDSAVNILGHNGLINLLEDWFFEEVQRDLRQRVAPVFWNFFENASEDGTENEKLEQNIACLLQAADYLHKISQEYQPCLQALESLPREINRNYSMLAFCGVAKVTDVVRILFKAVVFNRASREFRQCVGQFYSQAFRVFHYLNHELEQEEDEEESTECLGCKHEKDSCECQQITLRFHATNAKLDEVGVLEQVSATSVTALIHEQIQQHVENTCKGNFETAYLDSLENWLEHKVLGWLKLVYAGNRTNIGSDCIEGFKGRLLHFLWETYANVQIGQLFKIIIDFPESEPAILDLKTCLEKTDMRAHLVSTLKTSLETRLLHPGVNTADILTAYISAIRALRALDPAGVILELVCDPVRKYLRSREDTVRCIVSNLTDDGSNELLEELVKGQPLLDESAHNDEEDVDWEKWMPDPVDADPATASKSRRASDIISMLVNIYGSKELFVNEYRTLLADRILTNFNYEIEKEIRYLELLKLRFGESQLHFCEVMLKDVADSKRINSRITEERKQKGEIEDVEVNAMILSAQFWPAFREEKVTLPEHMQKLLEEYTRKFETQKGNRTLNWKSHLGLVNIDVELKDRTLNFSVSPVHAAIIMQFQEQERWTVEDLSSALQVPATALRRKIAYWQSQGLLKEEQTDTFLLVEEHKGRSHDIMIGEDEEAESAMASAHAQKEEELQVFWTYIVGMLSNLESLPLERIHSMLRMFAMQGTSGEITIHELKHFLDKKVKDQCLAYSGGVYRLPKTS
ncbi:anaphase-promoting complex subunit 2-like isoform X2 [Mercenaria mercenaria]|uniref:anaphase-promoting complex subunit 2-like isoform X2 n=1 Tax=Mercenaria mercenaria TaxID=6596 RepID=UPI00234F96EA|nr:anaphase-promoting complex subunit 2-like isoform X2 [Mercenaria mercenaria]